MTIMIRITPSLLYSVVHKGFFYVGIAAYGRKKSSEILKDGCFVYIFVDRRLLAFTLSTINKHMHIMMHDFFVFKIMLFITPVHKVS